MGYDGLAGLTAASRLTKRFVLDCLDVVTAGEIAQDLGLPASVQTVGFRRLVRAQIGEPFIVACVPAVVYIALAYAAAAIERIAPIVRGSQARTVPQLALVGPSHPGLTQPTIPTIDLVRVGLSREALPPQIKASRGSRATASFPES